MVFKTRIKKTCALVAAAGLSCTLLLSGCAMPSIQEIQDAFDKAGVEVDVQEVVDQATEAIQSGLESAGVDVQGVTENAGAQDEFADASTDGVSQDEQSAFTEAAADENAVVEEETSTETAATGAVVGGWTISTEPVATNLTSQEASIFEAATEGFVGVGYEPRAVIATQLVSGMNYAYLCLSTPVVQDPVPYWSVVVVYVDLSGNAQISAINPIDLTDIKTVEVTSSDSLMMGAWEVPMPGNAAVLPEDAHAAFNEAITAADLPLSPVALLGTQVVAGLNYKVLCVGTIDPATNTNALFVADVYRDISGGSQITSLEAFDLLHYIQVSE